MKDATTPLAILETEIHGAYRAHTPASAVFHERACRSLAGGVSGTVRYFRPYPLHFKEGQGSRSVDLDGHEYVDCFLCGASLMMGHRAPTIMNAISKTAEAGSLLLNPTLSTELAEAMQRVVPNAERVRLLNSGTEAVMSALRFARAFTGKPKIIKFYGTYHGQTDEMLMGLDLGSGRVGAGVTEGAFADLEVAELGNIAQLRDLLAKGGVAAILLDPSMHHCGLWVGTTELYREMKALAHQAGALLIFDEVISGFRLAAGGAQEFFGVTPDLAVFGKAFGAGERIGAVVGRADVMAVADPSRRGKGPFAFQSGTGNDSRNAIAAALAAVGFYERERAAHGYKRLAALAAQLAAGMREVFASHRIPLHVNHLGPMVRLFFTSSPTTHALCTKLDPRPLNLFHLALTIEGVLTLPGSNDFFLSFAHTSEDIDSIIQAAQRVLKRFDFRPVIGAVAS